MTDQEFALAQENLREYREYSKNRSGKKPYYICNTQRVTDVFDCSGERLMEENLHDAVLNGLRTQALYAVDAARIWEEKHRQKQYDVKGMRAELSKLEDSCTALDSHARELYEKFAFGELGREEYLLEKSAVVEKKNRISIQMEELETELQNAGTDGGLENRFTDSFSRYTEVEELTADIIEDVLQEIIVYPDHVLHIVWNYQDDLERLLLDIGMDAQNEKSPD